MEISGDIRIILNRCRMMNCIHEGQSFSASSMDGLCGDQAKGDLALATMLEQTLVMKKSSGAYSLTADGAAALKASAATFKQQVFPKRQFGRPPINKI